MRVAEFFAGIGLVRMALEQHGFNVVWANDINPIKLKMYRNHFGASEFLLEDIRAVDGGSMPGIDLATASFPCTDLSLAGHRRGLAGQESGMLWEFTRIIEKMDSRRPGMILLENVPGFATSNGGEDLRRTIERLNDLGYECDLLMIDARYFVPQSRQRLFIVGSLDPIGVPSDNRATTVRPEWMLRFARQNPSLRLRFLPLSDSPLGATTLCSLVECLSHEDPRWWEQDRVDRFLHSLSAVQRSRLDAMVAGEMRSWATAYRRTRHGKPVWEIRADAISGCLRAVSGGSSKQALVEAGGGVFRLRWMTALEYARLQGAGAYNLEGISEANALFGFGDAVCVPVVSWIAENYLVPLFSNAMWPESNLHRQEALVGV